jgi:hypothetical protein
MKSYNNKCVMKNWSHTFIVRPSHYKEVSTCAHLSAQIVSHPAFSLIHNAQLEKQTISNMGVTNCKNIFIVTEGSCVRFFFIYNVMAGQWTCDFNFSSRTYCYSFSLIKMTDMIFYIIYSLARELLVSMLNIND